jgi:hypothetical protein
MTATYRTFPQRVGYYQSCVALDTILVDEPLQDECGSLTLPSPRQELSEQGLCYVEVLWPCNQGDFYFAHVASTPETLHASNVQSVFLTEEQLHLTLPWDIRLAHATPDEIQSRIQAHAAMLRPVLPERVPVDSCYTTVADALEEQEDTHLSVLHEVCVSPEEMESVVTLVEEKHFPLQRALLHLVLTTLKPEVNRLSQGAFTLFQHIRAMLQGMKYASPHRKVVTLTYDRDASARVRFWYLTVRHPRALLSSPHLCMS